MTSPPLRVVEAPPGGLVDRRLDEFDRPVGHHAVDAARVSGCRRSAPASLTLPLLQLKVFGVMTWLYMPFSGWPLNQYDEPIGGEAGRRRSAAEFEGETQASRSWAW